MSVNATQVPQNPDLALFTLVGTWALVVIASITIIVTAWQTRRGQRLLNKQVGESIAQTALQQQQFTRMLEEQERPRIRELIRKVLTPAIQLIESNNHSRIRSYLSEEIIVHDRLVSTADQITRLAFDGFKKDYPELAPKIKAYDELSVDIKNKRAELRSILSADVKAMLPSALKEYEGTPIKGGQVKVGLSEPDVIPEDLVSRAIFPTLRQEHVQIRSTLELFWDIHSGKFMELVGRPKASREVGELKQLSQRSYDEGVRLIDKLNQLRDDLGSKYRIPRGDYFVAPPFG